MSTLVGRLGAFRQEPQTNYPLHEGVAVGHFVRADGAASQRYRPTAIECPYCHERLHESLTPLTRVVAVLDNGDILTDDLPPTHRGLVCGPCKQTFVSERERSRGA
jgi:hypothetical protein